MKTVRGWMSPVLDTAGLVCLDAAAWMAHPIAGAAVTGVLLLVAAWVIGR